MGWRGILRRRWGIGAGLLVIIAGLAAALVFLVRPVWRAEASLRIGATPAMGGVSAAQAGSPSGLFSLFQQMTGDPFANELELLASRTVIESIVRDNALDAELVAPRGWHRDSLFAYLRSSGESVEAEYEVEWLSSGVVRVRRTAPGERIVGEFAPGQEAVVGGLRASFLPHRTGMPTRVGLRTIPFGEAVRQASAELTAERKRREANLVRIAYASTDPGLALAVVRSAAEHYVRLRTELQRRESGQTTDSLRVVADQTLDELRREEVALEGFQRDAGLIAPEAQSEAFVARHTEIVSGLERARLELARTDEVLGRLATATDPSAAWAGLVAHPTFIDNPTLGDILTELIQLEQRRIALSSRRTSEDDEVRAVVQQIAFLDGSLRSLLSQYRAGVADGIRLLEAQEARMASVLSQVPSDAIELQRRQRTLRLLSEVYLFTDQRLRQESLRNALSFASVQIVDPPALLFKPVWPRKKLGLAIGLLLGTVFGLLGMAVVERADSSIRGFREARELTGVPVLAMLPADATRRGAAPGVREPVLRRNGSAPVTLLLTGVDDSGAVEVAARALRDRMARPAATGPSVTGAAPAEASPAQRVRLAQVGGSIAPVASPHPDRPSAAPEGDAFPGGPTSATRSSGARQSDATTGTAVRASGPAGTRQGTSYPGTSSTHPGGPGDPPADQPRLSAHPEIRLGPTIDSYAAALEAADALAGGTELVLVVRDGVTRRGDAAKASFFLREAGADPSGVIVVLDRRDGPGEA